MATATKKKVTDQAQDVADTVSDWVGDVADMVDFDAVKESAGEAASAVSDKLVAVAPLAAVASKKAFKRSTFAGLLVTGAIAWFLDPKKGEQRRSNAIGYFKRVAASISDKIGKPQTTTNPSTSNLNYNSEKA